MSLETIQPDFIDPSLTYVEQVDVQCILWSKNGSLLQTRVPYIFPAHIFTYKTPSHECLTDDYKMDL